MQRRRTRHERNRPPSQREDDAKVNAVVLSGGSAYGLASTVGVMEYLKQNGKGFKSMGKIVPIVCGAVLYDLNQRNITIQPRNTDLMRAKMRQKPSISEISAQDEAQR